MLKIAKNLLWAIMIASVVTGCGLFDQGGDEETPAPMEDLESTEVAAAPGDWSNNATDKSLGDSPLSDYEVIPNLNFPTIYFAYDSNALAPSETAKLDKVAEYINRYDNLYLIIEGHCDQRGTEEYNRSLGDRRANMIREYLVNANVKADKLRAISYGKDKPAVEGNTEEAWGKNRRGMLLPARKKANK